MKHLALFALLALAGCMTQPSVKSWLDPVSTATITGQTEPLVFTRPETRRTKNGRDYVRLTAIEVNRMGERRLYLVALLWSNANLAGKQWEAFESAFARIEVRIDDRPLALARHAGDAASLGIGESLLPLAITGSREVYYPIERAELRALAESKGVELIALGLSDAPLRYEENKDGRRSLGDFLSQLPGESSNAP